MLFGRGPTPRVKICGITGLADARLAIQSGADAIGFNFYPPSPRYIEPRAAARIARRLNDKVAKIGVFVDQSPETVRRTAELVGLDAVQLHGTERPSRVRKIATFQPVIKVFRVRRGFPPSRLARYPAATAFLLDGYSRGRHGGTGRQVDWNLARRAKRYGRVILAGGLRPENVAEAILRARPYAIDVCSGIELKPGKKDAAKMREFMRQVKRSRRARR